MYTRLEPWRAFSRIQGASGQEDFDEVKLPTKITYQGNWDYPFKKEERASFLVVHKDYQLGKGN